MQGEDGCEVRFIVKGGGEDGEEAGEIRGGAGGQSEGHVCK